MKRYVMAIAASTALMGAAMSATAADDGFGLSPAACEEAVSYFLDDRLYDSRSARVQLSGDPYRVVVNMRSGDVATVWAVDVHVKSRLPSGSWSNYQPYTVIFHNGMAVGLESDFRNVTPV